VSIFVGGRTGTDPRPGEKIIELLPVTMLEEVVPLMVKHLDLLRKVRRDREFEERVVMVPALDGASNG
jgi:hypothetical protein